ncbi:MAG: hypothetical protein ACKVHL_08290 [Rhodospirillales bacterium]|jgi:hypothetical protein
MAEVSETGNVFDVLVSRQRSENTQGVRQQDDDDERRNNGQRSAQSTREEQPQDSQRATQGVSQGEQVERFNATQQLTQSDNQNVFERVIDQSGNAVSGSGEQALSGVQADQQRLADETSQRQQRVEERRIQERADRTEQRLQEQVSGERAELASSDPSLPRGSVVDISA